MKARTYKILQDCIERGLEYSVKKAVDEDDLIEEDYFISQALNNIMTEIAENFSFDEGE